METKIIALLETKNFADLTNAEKNLVLTEMSEVDYTQQRELILETQTIFSAERKLLIPNPNILAAAQNKLAEQNTVYKKGSLFILFQHKVPTWAAAAACISILITFWSLEKYIQSAPEKIVVTEQLYDTIYTEKLITETIELPSDTVVKLIYKNGVEKEQGTTTPATNLTSDNMQFPIEAVYFAGNDYCSLMSCYESKKGIPAAKDTLLKLSWTGM